MKSNFLKEYLLLLFSLLLLLLLQDFFLGFD
jgi:hypothetical protein